MAKITYKEIHKAFENSKDKDFKGRVWRYNDDFESRRLAMLQHYGTMDTELSVYVVAGDNVGYNQELNVLRNIEIEIPDTLADEIKKNII